MALIIALNAILCCGVIVMVVSPLVWAIFTQHRDHPVAVATTARAAGRTTPRPEGAPTRRPEVVVA